MRLTTSDPRGNILETGANINQRNDDKMHGMHMRVSFPCIMRWNRKKKSLKHANFETNSDTVTVCTGNL